MMTQREYESARIEPPLAAFPDIEQFRDEGGYIRPECAVCQAIGDPCCYEHHGMLRSLAQVALRSEVERVWQEIAEADARAEDEMFKRWLTPDMFAAYREEQSEPAKVG